MSSPAVDLVLRYIELTQRARRDQSDEAWQAVGSLLAEDVETRLAGGRAGNTWQSYRGRAARLERLRRAEVDAARLETQTVRAFGSEDGLVAVEQISTVRGEDGSMVSLPVCFIFEVADDRIIRISVYRNMA
jgi:ketosteroid isomerase-like protein